MQNIGDKIQSLMHQWGGENVSQALNCCANANADVYLQR
jgi:hypothetical protein